MTTFLPFQLVSGRDADLVAYDNSTSGLTASQVQAAIDELDSTIDGLGGGDFSGPASSTDNAIVRIDGLGGGDFSGPASSTDNAIVRFDGTTGKLGQNSGVIISDTNDITGVNDLTVTGDLTVNGTTTTVNTATLSVEDPLIQLANANNTTDSIDIGFVGLYDTSGTQDLYCGLFRDATDGVFNLFVDSQEDLSTASTVNKLATGYTRGTLDANLTGGTVSSLSSAIAIADGGTGATTILGAQQALDLEPGVDIQAYDAGLASIAGLTTAADTMIYTTALDTYATTTLSSFARTLLDDADAATMRTTLGVDPAGTDNSTNVTIAAGLDYITISGQELTLGSVDLTTDVTGDLPFANIAQIATDSFLGRDTAGTGDIEVLSAATARTILNVADGAEANLDWLTTQYQDGVDFTAGSSTTLTMPQAAPADDEDHVLVFFHGLAQHQDQWTISGTTITFSAAIPTGVTDVEIRVLA
jgi:hypothetical protein